MYKFNRDVKFSHRNYILFWLICHFLLTKIINNTYAEFDINYNLAGYLHFNIIISHLNTHSEKNLNTQMIENKQIITNVLALESKSNPGKVISTVE